MASSGQAESDQARIDALADQARRNVLAELPRDREAELPRKRAEPSYAGARPVLTRMLPAGRTNPDGTMMLSFEDPDGWIFTFRLPVGEIRTMTRCLGQALEAYDRARRQAESSSGTPSNDGSPTDGQVQVPDPNA